MAADRNKELVLPEPPPEYCEDYRKIDPDKLINELKLDLTPREVRQYTPPRGSVITFHRKLTEVDLIAHEESIREARRAAPAKPPLAVSQIRDSHHALARCLAMGMKLGEAGAEVGMGAEKVRTLVNDPTFQGLVDYYRDEVDAKFATMQSRMARLSNDALEELAYRLENDPEKIPTPLLLELVKVMADRTGNGPQAKVTSVNVNVDFAGQLEAARNRVNRMLAEPPPVKVDYTRLDKAKATDALEEILNSVESSAAGLAEAGRG